MPNTLTPAPAAADLERRMSGLDHPLRAEIDALRPIILGATGRLAERWKWNAPSYHLGKHDFGAFNLRETRYVHLTIVYPKGTAPMADTDLLTGDFPDRRFARFTDMADVENKRAALEAVVRDWVEKVEEVGRTTAGAH